MEIDARKVKELRDLTEAGILDCKSALLEANCDLQKAVEILKKKGIAKAQEKAKRQAREGRIGSYIHTNGKVGAIVELCCETDFVARNEEFNELLHDLCLQVVGASPIAVSKEEVRKDIIEQEKAKYEEDVKGKPPEIAQKIIDGKLQKFFYSQKCLLDQNFINEAKFKGTVDELIKSKIAKLGENILVRRFIRFELGE
jgi:elongation factor Ts